MRDRNKIWMSSEEFKEKSKITCLEKFGNEHFSKTDHFKDIIKEKKEEIVSKIKQTFLENSPVLPEHILLT
jgi:flagellar basal body rod protein FlgG